VEVVLWLGSFGGIGVDCDRRPTCEEHRGGKRQPARHEDVMVQ
jgi:hypothetical protein